MKITYAKSIERKLKDLNSIKRYYGKLSQKIWLRLSLLIAAENLEQIPNVPPTSRHKLTGNYKDCWGITIEKNWRIVIRPLSEKETEPKNINEVLIIEIVDYH